NRERGSEKNVKLIQLYQTPDILEEIGKRRLRGAGHVWRKKGALIRTIQSSVQERNGPLKASMEIMGSLAKDQR
ncbi:Hypothetical protein CINCED_3A001055, partial [Cinara cedri]